MNMRCNRGKASLDTLVSRKTEKSSSCNLQILWHTAANLCRSSERACGIDLHDEAWRRHGDQRQQKRCRRGDSWCHFDAMDGKWRSLQNIHWHFLSLTARLSPRGVKRASSSVRTRGGLRAPARTSCKQAALSVSTGLFPCGQTYRDQGSTLLSFLIPHPY